MVADWPESHRQCYYLLCSKTATEVKSSTPNRFGNPMTAAREQFRVHRICQRRPCIVGWHSFGDAPAEAAGLTWAAGSHPTGISIPEIPSKYLCLQPDSTVVHR